MVLGVRFVRGRQAQVRIVRRLVAEGDGPLPQALAAHEVDPEAFLTTLDRLIREDAGDDAMLLVRRLLQDGSSRLARALDEHGVDAEAVLVTIEDLAEADGQAEGDDDGDVVELPPD